MKVIIIGCTYAGVAVVNAIRQFHPDTDVTVYERDDNVSFLSCGIALYLDGEVTSLEDMFYETPEHLASQGTTVRTLHDVIKVDPDTKTVTVQNLATKEIFTDSYDKLVMTTGSYVQVPPIEGIDESRVLLCKDSRQAEAIKQSAQTQHHIAIVGAGYTGVELAESYANTDHDVTLIQSNSQLLNNFVDPEISELIEDQLTSHGVSVRLDSRVEGFYGNPETDGVRVRTATGDVEADLAIVSTGFLAATDLLKGKVTMNRKGAILTNEWMQTSDPDIYAAGDACAVHFNPTGNYAYIPLATNAVRQGYLVGRNLFGNVQKDLGTQASTAMRLFSYNLATTGLTLTGAQRWKIPAASVTYKDTYRPSFMPTNADVTIKLVYNTQDRRILGAQLWSQHEITQSANAVSIAIQNRNTIDDLAMVDMLFNPHYDQPFNYLNLAAQMAIEDLDFSGRKA